MDQSLLVLLEAEKELVSQIKNAKHFENMWLERENNIKYIDFPCREISSDFAQASVIFMQKLRELRKQIKEYFEFIQNSFVDVEGESEE